MKIVDALIHAAYEKQNPTIMGLDTRAEYLPAGFDMSDPQECAHSIFEFNKQLIDGLADIVPAVKVQVAFYEMYGLHGMETLYKTLCYAKEAGLIVVADAKRGDIGSTAEAYSRAFLGQAAEDGLRDGFPADMLTVNPYLGADGIAPFLKDCARFDKGIFVLVKTSNPSSGEFQDLVCQGKPLYEHIAESVSRWGESLIGDCGYSDVGAVVGATYPEQGKYLREKFTHLYFLVPGYGAQGATGKDLRGCFDENGWGAIVNASRSILCAHKQSRLHFVDAARQEALRMRADLLGTIGEIGRPFQV